MGFFSGLKGRAVRKAIEELRKKTLGDIMTTYVLSISPDESVIHAATKMVAEDISCLVAMKGEKLAGILSERDFLHKVPLNKKAFGMKVKDIMTPNVVTATPETLLTDAMATMKQKNFRRMVVASGEKVVGIVTQTDFSRVILKTFASFPVSDALSVEAIMSKKVLTATVKETFAEARKKMQKLNVGSILIMDKGECQGIFTEYDVVMQFYDQDGELRLKDLATYMRKYVRATVPSLSIFEANKILVEKRMRRLPIVSEGKVVGIVTQTDITRFVLTNLDKITSIVEKSEEFAKCKKEYPGEFSGDRLKVYE